MFFDTKSQYSLGWYLPTIYSIYPSFFLLLTSFFLHHSFFHFPHLFLWSNLHSSIPYIFSFTLSSHCPHQTHSISPPLFLAPSTLNHLLLLSYYHTLLLSSSLTILLFYSLTFFSLLLLHPNSLPLTCTAHPRVIVQEAHSAPLNCVVPPGIWIPVKTSENKIS